MNIEERFERMDSLMAVLNKKLICMTEAFDLIREYLEEINERTKKMIDPTK